MSDIILKPRPTIKPSEPEKAPRWSNVAYLRDGTKGGGPPAFDNEGQAKAQADYFIQVATRAGGFSYNGKSYKMSDLLFILQVPVRI